jgi:outer membrane protein assembly factor BamD (BamD/ComL family)
MKNVVFVSLIAFAVYSCNSGAKKELNEKEKLVLRIDSLETKINESINKTENPDVQLAMYAIEAYDKYVSELPNDTISPKYLLKSAQLCDGVLRRSDWALTKYNKFLEYYPEHKQAPMILFYAGNAYSEIGDTTNAIANFTLFSQKYPNHEFADDALGLIRFMRLNEDELKQFFNKKEEKRVN